MYPGPSLAWIKRQAASCTICEVRGCKGAQASRAAAQAATATGAGDTGGGHWETVGHRVALAPSHFPAWMSPGALLQPKALAKKHLSQTRGITRTPYSFWEIFFSGENSKKMQ